MDGSQVASAIKKNKIAISRMGRPKKGALSTYADSLVEKIKAIRKANKGWGVASILDELVQEHGYEKSQLPSTSSVNRYLKQSGLIEKTYERRGKVPRTRYKRVKKAHDLWEVDAQGAVKAGGIGYQAMINMKDTYSLKYCMAYPVSVNHQRHQPATIHYQWAFRLAFEESGLPGAVQLDKDSVFYENQSKSPYPSRIQLWLTGLGMRIYFITLPPPLKQSKVERSHQTIDRQVLLGQTYKHWKQLFQKVNKRRERLNVALPCASLGNKPPLAVYPEAVHSGRPFATEQEYAYFDLNPVYKLVAKYTWYRKVSNVKTVSLGRKIYFLKKAKPKSQVKVRFSKRTKMFIFRDVNERLIAKLPPKGISKEALIGANQRELKYMKYKIQTYRNFPLKT